MVKQALIRLHVELCAELRIEPARIVFRKEAKDCDDLSEVLGYYNNEKNQIVLYLGTTKRHKKDIRRVLAHETYHHYQKRRGWLRTDTWKDRPKVHYAFTSYRKLPWEAGAIRFENKIAKRKGWK